MWYQCENMSRVTSAQSTAPEGEGESSGQVLWTCLIDVSLRTCLADVSCGRVGGCPQALGRWRKGGGGECLESVTRISEVSPKVSRKCLGSVSEVASESVWEVSRKCPTPRCG